MLGWRPAPGDATWSRTDLSLLLWLLLKPRVGAVLLWPLQVETGSAITWKYPSVVLKGDNSVGEFYSVALTNNRQQVGGGRRARRRRRWARRRQARICASYRPAAATNAAAL